MSRHKVIKNLDLDDELDDYDGGGDYVEEEGEGTAIFAFLRHNNIADSVKQSLAKKIKVRSLSGVPLRDSMRHVQSILHIHILAPKGSSIGST